MYFPRDPANFNAMKQTYTLLCPATRYWRGLMVSSWTSVCPSVRSSARLSYVRPYFVFWTITSKYQWIFTKLGMSVDIVEIWFGIANGQSSILTVISGVLSLSFLFLHDSI